MIRFILENAVDTSTLDTSPIISDTQYEVDNIKKISRLRPMRSDDADDSFTITGELSGTEVVDVSAMVIARHNFSVNTTYRIRLFDVNDAEVYDSLVTSVTNSQAATALYEWGSFNWGAINWGADKKQSDNRQWYDLVWWEPNGTVIPDVHSFEITLAAVIEGGTYALYCNDQSIYCHDATITCDLEYLTTGAGEKLDIGIPYFEIGRVYIGEYIEPVYNISLGHGISWVEKTQQYRPSSGTLRSDYTTTNRRFDFALKTIPEADIERLHKPLVAKGLRNDFYISVFPTDDNDDKEVDYSGLMKFTKVPKYTEYIKGFYRSNYIMEEI